MPSLVWPRDMLLFGRAWVSSVGLLVLWSAQAKLPLGSPRSVLDIRLIAQSRWQLQQIQHKHRTVLCEISKNADTFQYVWGWLPHSHVLKEKTSYNGSQDSEGVLSIFPSPYNSFHLSSKLIVFSRKKPLSLQILVMRWGWGRQTLGARCLCLCDLLCTSNLALVLPPHIQSSVLLQAPVCLGCGHENVAVLDVARTHLPLLNIVQGQGIWLYCSLNHCFQWCQLFVFKPMEPEV